MTPAEFKERFKVGDTVKCLEKTYYCLLITAIGEEYFLAKTQADVEDKYCFSFDWWVRVEQEKKPSEEIREISGGKLIKFIGTCAQVDKQSNFQYIHNRMDAIEEWIDENWPKVAKK